MTDQCCKAKIGPSILNADMGSLSDACVKFLDSGADFLHLDVMDGHFVPNLTFGHPMVQCLRPKMPKAFFDMHMMVANPQQWVQPMADAGATQYTFHYEATDDVSGCIRKIREHGMKVGLGIKPKTPADVVLPFAEEVDMVLVMTVEPGFGGQKFMADMMPKIRYLRSKFRLLDIEVDGGVSSDTVEECAKAGANMIVSGSALVKSADPKSVMEFMRKVVSEAMSSS